MGCESRYDRIRQFRVDTDEQPASTTNRAKRLRRIELDDYHLRSQAIRKSESAPAIPRGPDDPRCEAAPSDYRLLMKQNRTSH